MIPQLFLSAVLLAISTPAPMPTATPMPWPVFIPPPTITHERVSPVCTTLHGLVLPLAKMQTQYRAGTVEIQKDERQLAKYSKTKLQDGVLLYASKIDQASTNLIDAIHQIEEQLKKSFEAYPQGKYPKVDAMRQRVQNVIDVERATADRYQQIYGTIVDNYGADVLQGLDKEFGQPPPSFNVDTMPTAATPAPAPEFQTPPPTVPADYDPRLSGAPTEPITAHALKYYRLRELRSALQAQGRALISQALIAAHDCDGI